MKKSKIYIGLDIGTESVGWAVTDQSYQLKRYRGNLMWGVHLFDEANQAAERRSFRTARRRLDRRKQRIQLLQELLGSAILEKDTGFFLRLKESALLPEDFQYRTHDLYFIGSDYNDAAFHKDYPTIHHLICELMNNPAPHDVRLVYIACAYLLAHRGHFLREIEPDKVEELLDFSELYNALRKWFGDYDAAFPFPDDSSELQNIMRSSHGVTFKEKELKARLFDGCIPRGTEECVEIAALIKLLAGGTVKLSALFKKEKYQELDKDSVCIAAADFDDRLPELSLQLDDGHCDLLCAVKNIYDWSLLMGLLSETNDSKTATVSGAKVKIYETHQQDLKDLKLICRSYLTKKQYDEIFQDESITNNYVWYSYHFKGGKTPEKGKKAKQEDFCKFINGYLKNISAKKRDVELLERLKEKAAAGTLCPKQVTTDNRVIPYQLNYRELKCILDNASGYIPLLRKKDEFGTVADKILSIMRFRIPYYVGPLVSESNSDHAWMVRKAEGKIYPWNFEQKVDHEKSEACFIRRMTCACSYLAGEEVLPKNSLLYSKFCVLNEINNLAVDGERIPVAVKQNLYEALFEQSKRRVTKKSIQKYLCAVGYMTESQTLSGVDDTLKSILKSYHDFHRFLIEGILTEADAEAIIERITVTTDKPRLKKWLKEWSRSEHKKLSPADINYLVNLNYQDYGRLSRKLLEEIYDIEPTSGECRSKRNIITALWETNENLMQLLSDKHSYSSQIESKNHSYYAENPKTLDQKMDALYLPKPVRRAVSRTLDIMKELKKLLPNNPDRIFIEMARGGDPNQKGKRTQSRRTQIEKWLSEMRKDLKAAEFDLLTEQLSGLDDNRLRRDKYYLYFMQLGKCMYSGQPIDFSQIDNNALYNIDHIYPQSKTMDDSLDNQVLVLSELNGQKGDKYPIKNDIRRKMQPFWESLQNKNLISRKKYERLTRSTEFSDEELSGFVQRQLVETRQSTKAVSVLLKELFPETEIVYVKAGLVSQFRHDLDFLKCREINDLHHAKDAYLNIVIGNVYHERFTKRFFERIKTEQYSLRLFEKQDCGKARGLLNYPVENAWDPATSFDIVRRMMSKNSIRYVRYCYRRKHGQNGGFFDQNPLRAGHGMIPLKLGKAIEKYGGYDNATISFYMIAKVSGHGAVLIPVELLYADQMEKDTVFAAKYAAKKAGEIIKKEIRPDCISFPLGNRIIKINALLEFNGFRINMSAKTGSRIRYVSAMSLILPKEQERYLKRLLSYAEKSDNGKKYDVSAWDHLTKEENIVLYDLICHKCSQPPFSAVYQDIGEKIAGKRDVFMQMPLREQALTLLTVVSLLKTGRKGGINLSALGEGSQTGTKDFNMQLRKIKGWDGLYLIDQSPTGLIECRSQNLLAL